MAEEQPWYERAFAHEYLELYHHRSSVQGQQQVNQMLGAGLIPKRGSVLDLCCGAGRHLQPMRASGLDAVGLDLSMDLLETGKLAGIAVRADARAVPYADGQFDVVTNLFSSFGYFPDDDAHHRVLTEVTRVLKPGGRFLIDHMNAEVTIRDLKPESIDERDGLTLRQWRRYDAENKRVIKDIEYTLEGMEPRRWHESVRLFTPAELDEFLTQAGLRVEARHGDLDGSRFHLSTSRRQVVLAVRA
ncbi:MAG: methyltransferase domain-containing protein [Planctomycetes bacterium]|nr:methyltransferase domain-containing protein [Planctomycetota bacterium]